MRNTLAGILGLGLFTVSAHAAFHVMQIEQIIGGLNGDKTAQAIQLRMRGGGQTGVSAGRLEAWDANGANPILLLDIASNVTNGNGGDNILLTTVSFNSKMATVPGFSSDFTLTNPIPAAYLNGGKITFESDGGSPVYWSVAFGAYTGTNTGDNTNITGGPGTGSFGSPFAGALPSATLQGIHFTGAFGAFSTNNATDYALTSTPATVRNNARTTFTVVPEPASLSFLALGAASLGGMVFARRRRR